MGKMDQYPVIVVPECDYLEPAFLDSLRTYVKKGGSLLIIGAETAQMFMPELGIVSMAKSSQSEAFIAARGKIGSVRSDLLQVSLKKGCKPLSVFYQGSDFNYPGEYVASSANHLGKGKVAGIYFNAGTAYTEYKTPVIRDFLMETLQELMPDKLVEVTGSHLVHVSVNRLNDRLYINLINVAGEHTNQSALGYDEVPSLKDIEVSVRTAKRPAGIMLQPEGRTLPFSYTKGRSTVLVPELPIHSVLELIAE
jgi:hypothetical protein